MSLNYNKMKKRYLSVTLADEQETTIMIGTPTKAIMDDLLFLQSNMSTVSENSPEVLDALYDSCARIMSRNKDGIKISTDYLAEIFDFEDILIFFNAYMTFVNELADSKN